MVSFYSLFIWICLTFYLRLNEILSVQKQTNEQFHVYAVAATQSDWQNRYKRSEVRPSDGKSRNSNLFNGEAYWKLFYVFGIWLPQKHTFSALFIHSVPLVCRLSRFSHHVEIALICCANQNIDFSLFVFGATKMGGWRGWNRSGINATQHRKKKNNIWTKAIMSKASSSNGKVSKVNYRKSKKLQHKS